MMSRPAYSDSSFCSLNVQCKDTRQSTSRLTQADSFMRPFYYFVITS